MRRKELLFFSPLPPKRNGIADYSASILGALSDQFYVHAVVSNDAILEPPPGVDLLRLAEYTLYDHTFSRAGYAYQLGNNYDHHYMLPVLARHPGLSTIHDLSFQHMISAALPDGAKSIEYAELMFECYGAYGREIARETHQFGRQSHVVHTECGFLPVFARRSAGLVTHSLLGRLRLAACGFDRPIYQIDHHCRADCSPFRESRSTAKARSRARLGLPQDATILMALGFVNRAKRLDLVLRALASLRAQHRDLVLVIAGQRSMLEYDVEADILALGLRDTVILRDYVPDDQLLDYLASGDVLVNLRYPTLGENSGSLANGLGVGCCAIVTDIGSYAELPDRCVAKVPLADMTAKGVARYLSPLVAFPEVRARYETAAADYASTHLSSSKFIENYVRAIEEVLFPVTQVAMPAQIMHRRLVTPTDRRTIEQAANTIALRQAPTAQMWWRELLLPMGDPDGRLLVIADCKFAVGLSELGFGWSGRVDLWNGRDAPIISEKLYDAILVIVDAGEFLSDGGQIIAHANRLLHHGGNLVVNLTGPIVAELDRMFDFEDRLPSAATLGRPSSPLGCALENGGFIVDAEVERFSEISDFESDGRRGLEAAVRGRRLFPVQRPTITLPLRRY